MKLHIFNPEHDLALASNLAHFTPPHAARHLRADLSYLPALWANEGDYVLVENAEYAANAYRRFLSGSKFKSHHPRWILKSQLENADIDEIEPWGWDAPLCNMLIRNGISRSLLPSLELIDEIRMLSHRSNAADFLPHVRLEGTVGEAFPCATVTEVHQYVKQYRRLVLKAPWSSSGRGIRFIDGELNSYHTGWLRNVIERQGCVMVEPYYRKVKDFGMEFYRHKNGMISYEGLSLFHTSNGAYTGNLLMTENAKRAYIAQYVTLDLLDHVCAIITNNLSLRHYYGTFGVDMMIVAQNGDEGFLLHPCVEINLRRTMGHVALAVSPDSDDVKKVMRIQLTDSYKLKINKL